MNPTSLRRFALLALCALLIPVATSQAQGVTSGSITGIVNDPQGQPVPGATVLAVHEPSGSRYEANTRARRPVLDPRHARRRPLHGDGHAQRLPAQAVAGRDRQPRHGHRPGARAQHVTVSEEVTVTGESSDVFSSARTGAATTVGALGDRDPAHDRRPHQRLRAPDTAVRQQRAGRVPGSFAGMDSRFNNLTVDGSYFNNSFGLQGQPGDRTGVAPIAMEAVEEIQVSVAPYDVRQGNFVGAGINSVTRSGGNQFRGSAYYWFRDDSLVGTEAKGLPFNPGTFDFKKWGGWLSGPIIKDKLFFFVSFEDEALTQPGTTFRANTGGETVQGSVTRVLASDLDSLGSYLNTQLQVRRRALPGLQLRDARPPASWASSTTTSTTATS